MNIKFLAKDDRPREKLLLKGKNALSDAELLAIIMGSGNKNESAVELARRILQSVENNWTRLSQLTIKDLTLFKGVGEVKAISIITALEIGKRKALEEIPEKPQIKCSKDAYEIIKPYLSDLRNEEFWCLYLNQSNKVLHKERLTQGGISQSIVDIRVLFSLALSHFATSIVVAHNHPSGNLSPSNQDIQITQSIKEAGDILNIKLLDHLIVTQNSYYSFADQNVL